MRQEEVEGGSGRGEGVKFSFSGSRWGALPPNRRL